jgi:hypothetical protein
VAQHHDESCADPLRGKLNAVDLRRGDDISGYPDDKQVAKALIAHNLYWHSRIGTSQDDGERLLDQHQLTAALLERERVPATKVRHEAAVSLPQAFECFLR